MMEVKHEKMDDMGSGSPPPPIASPVVQQRHVASPQQEEEQIAPVMLTTMQPVPLVSSENYSDDRQIVYQVDGKHVEFVRQVSWFNKYLGSGW